MPLNLPELYCCRIERETVYVSDEEDGEDEDGEGVRQGKGKEMEKLGGCGAEGLWFWISMAYQGLSMDDCMSVKVIHYLAMMGLVKVGRR